MRDLHYARSHSEGVACVDFPFAEPQDPAVMEQYQDWYQCAMRFDQPVGRFWVRESTLSQPLKTADSAGNAAFRQQCMYALKAQQSEAHGWQQDIHAFFYLRSEGVPDMKALSRLLDMPERTLRYRLQCEGSSYRELRDEVLQQQAGALLATTHLPVGQIAERLGYAEPAAFIRAFQRMSG